MSQSFEEALVGRRITQVSMHRDDDGAICGLHLDDGSYLGFSGSGDGQKSKVWAHLDPEGGAPTGADD